MTTTLRPSEPLQQHPDGTRSRRYRVCVNSRPVGEIHLGTSPALGAAGARILDLRIAEPDRRRGRGTVAALTAEEVARSWGCTQIDAVVPVGAEAALRLFTALGYTLRNRGMEKRLAAVPPELPPGSRARPMTGAEFDEWQEHESEQYTREWIARGVPEATARAKARDDHEMLLPDGLATDGMLFSVLEHEGVRVGTLWVALQDAGAFIFTVETATDRRGQGHGRALMLLAERQAIEAGRQVLGLNVFAGNTPAERLYASLGYRTVNRSLAKPLG
ncbi:N-acetyltransferase [Streptomyces pluripotens]|uniref:N-acetyltransferase n=1 Tax=Streptomyces pluripotens TaxID=1355015 RepID=A0A221NUT7_9ACTN|nr:MULTISPECIES: GNAT family N-acetyltransferase [Streptomyces]ARP69328.1 N-acetyltransferase [Streptomyces pluripotens]ASN23586.1 N-acetyltransferase [Streptomyces pluripotens]KIE28381.1 acetyltransferase [Streptomyces sp. MUSC 125]MCH0555269.1 GNAT family N-acetyltransferase [Streptomyces sp. MUM 16J]